MGVYIGRCLNGSKIRTDGYDVTSSKTMRLGLGVDCTRLI